MVQANATAYARAHAFVVLSGKWERAKGAVVRLGGFDKLPTVPMFRVRSEAGGHCVLERGIAVKDRDRPSELGANDVASLGEFLAKAEKEMVVFLLARGGEPVRAYRVTWKHEEWLPLGLDATSDDVACERVQLGGCTYEELEQWR